MSSPANQCTPSRSGPRGTRRELFDLCHADVALLHDDRPRVLGLFTIYFLALLVQSLIERELRNALNQAAAEDANSSECDQGVIDIYPEGRRTRRPTARRATDALEPLRRQVLVASEPWTPRELPSVREDVERRTKASMNR